MFGSKWKIRYEERIKIGIERNRIHYEETIKLNKRIYSLEDEVKTLKANLFNIDQVNKFQENCNNNGSE